MDYDRLFQTALGGLEPFPYQRRLAVEPELPEALIAPTGAGKTAAVVLAWLHRRRYAGAEMARATPRRLVLCLPMRTLVQQAADVCRTWLDRLAILDAGTGLGRGDGVAIHVLMGGAEDDDWHLHPGRDAVIIGTQDMLLSGALNRGYGVSRFAWPWRFALLSNDSLWAFDEVQLMSVGFSTGLQLATFRRALGSFGPVHSLFLSATLEPSWLRTVDHPQPGRVLRLGPEDLATEALVRRRAAVKRLSRARTSIAKGFEKAFAREVLDRHVPGTRTLVVLNTVDGAVATHEEIQKAARGNVATALLHSRFRKPDRDAALARALAPGFDGIVVSTQVIEAGVDISSRTLVTQLAPWPSLVQRAGRCNRAGEEPEADVVWVDHEDLERGAEPYAVAELAVARSALERMGSFNPQAIDEAGVEMARPEADHVLRRRDVLDLFDTTPDLSGADIDVSRFIREGPERDVQVFWRPLGEESLERQVRPERDELCPAPVGILRDALGGRTAYRWVAHEGLWKPVRRDELFPGLVLMLDAAQGGYEAQCGLRLASKVPVPLLRPDGRVGGSGQSEESLDDDRWTEIERRWVTLREHASDARRAAEELVAEMGGLGLPGEALVFAALTHDIGKGHPVFVDSMERLGGEKGEIWAKSGGKKGRLRHRRRGFRHELASALAVLQAGLGPAAERDLVAYLVAAHHGKLRLSIRALPTEEAPPGERLFARGVHDGDEMPALELDGVSVPGLALSLAPMKLGSTSGGPSWTDRALRLREVWGPFRLAFLEAVVRAADVRASQREEQE